MSIFMYINTIDCLTFVRDRSQRIWPRVGYFFFGGVLVAAVAHAKRILVRASVWILVLHLLYPPVVCCRTAESVTVGCKHTFFGFVLAHLCFGVLMLLILEMLYIHVEREAYPPPPG